MPICARSSRWMARRCGGIQVANRFNAVPLGGTTTIAGNVLERTGTLDLFAHIGNGALWFWASDEAMNGTVNVTQNFIYDSSYEAIQFYGSSITNLDIDQNILDKAGTFPVQLNGSGSAMFSHVIAFGLGAGNRYDCNSGFNIVEGAGNSGWSDTHSCSYPPPGPLTLSAQNLQFVASGIGQASAPQTVTITNPSSHPVAISSITTTGTFFIQSTSAGNPAALGFGVPGTIVLAPNAALNLAISFVPSPNGDRGGALTVSDGTPAGRYQVDLTGTVIIRQPGNLAADQPTTTSSLVPGFPGANAVDSNSGTYWESLDNAPWP